MAGPHTIDVSEADFKARVIQQSFQRPVVVDFWAEWCGPCRILGPVLEELAAEGGGAWVLAKLDTDANQDLARLFRIQGIPAVKAFVDGQVVDEFVGVRGKAEIQQWLAGLAPSEADKLCKSGLHHLDAGQLEAAARDLGAALEQEPRHPRALLGSARLALALQLPDDAREVLARFPEEHRPAHAAELSSLALQLEALAAGDPEELRQRVQADPRDLDARHALAMALHARGQVEPALEQLLEIVRRDRKWRDDEGRKAMLRIFEDIGARSPVAEAWRRRLSMELF